MTEEKKNKIMIVDDDDFLVNMYATKFANSDIAVEACKSGDDFFEKLKTAEGIDLILLDIVMPGMTGIDILKKMREEKLGENIPVIMLTNQSDEDSIKEAKQFNIAGYIVKSAATPSEVINEVINIIKNSK